ncbi:UvrD-helicase domain-containing protein, partial [Xanthomonas vasicola]
MSISPVTDPYLQLPLHGVRLIEASAGTGKTFTLATLFTRLVVERGLRIGQILAVTFTEAATQELRRRIRERLVLAASLVPDAPVGAALAATEWSATQPPDAPSASVGAAPAAAELADDPSRPRPLLHEAPDALLTRAILATHLAGGNETPAALRRRLQQAVEEIDLAAVFTIHGFCARVLREHALESGQAFAAPELLANDRELLGEVAADLWRQRAADAAMAEDLIALWSGGPEALASDLRALVRHP